MGARLGCQEKYFRWIKYVINGAPEDRPGFMNYMRMSDGHFNILLKKLETRIQKQDKFFREAIPAKTKLEITLRFLATGESYSSLQYFFRVPKCTISLFVPDVCTEIYNVLENFIKCPSSVEEWNEIGKNVGLRWNCPDCYGEIDGKHIVIKAPANSGSEFFNYKGSFSIVLLAVVDHDYCFRYLDVGANGRCSDGGIFRNSSLKLAIENDFLNLPENGYFVADDAFPLTKYMMKPYSRRKLSKEHYIFNYRLSRARRIVENAFGILAHRFQIYLKPIQLQPSKVEEIIKATCALHNWLRITSGSTYMPPGSYDEELAGSTTVRMCSWHSEIQPTGLVEAPTLRFGQNYPRSAIEKRELLCKYFNEEGAVPWQENIFDV